VSEIYHERQQPLLGPRTPVQRFYTPEGPVYVPVASELQACQPIRRETMRVIRRTVQTADGRTGIEVTEEHDVIYGPPRAHASREHDAIRTGLAGVVAFLIVCLGFSMLGGGDQSPALIPLYWVAFVALWWALA
jgi:hypothetical protein